MINSIKEEFQNAFSRPNNAMVQLIIINVAVFLVIGIIKVFTTLAGSQEVASYITEYLLLSDEPSIFITRPWTLITYAFNHSGLWHLFMNMLFLYWFGKLITEYLGSQKLVNLYILGSITGGLAFLLMFNLLPVFDKAAYLIGASGAVYAIVVGAATLSPNYTFYLLLVGPVKIKYIAAFFVVLSFLGTAEGNAGGNFAHLGGALIGFVYINQLQKGNDIGAWIYSIYSFIKSFFVRQSKIKVTHKKEARQYQSNTGSKKRTRTEQEEIDAILDKISASGYESLSKAEKQKLFEASKKN